MDGFSEIALELEHYNASGLSKRVKKLLYSSRMACRVELQTVVATNRARVNAVCGNAVARGCASRISSFAGWTISIYSTLVEPWPTLRTDHPWESAEEAIGSCESFETDYTSRDSSVVWRSSPSTLSQMPLSANPFFMSLNLDVSASLRN